MLANAVTSAVDRLYAGTAVADDRTAVSRVGKVDAVPRVRPVAEGESTPENRSDRDGNSQRQALTRGVIAVFESGTKPAGPLSTTDTAEAPSAAESRRLAAEEENRAVELEDQAPDPVLEEAIQRFIKTMFRSLAAAEEAGLLPPFGPAVRAGASAGNSAAAAGAAGAVSGRGALSARIGALAEGLSSQSAGAFAGPMDQAYAEVMQVLKGNLGGGDAGSPEQRGQLVSLMKRLAGAMQGQPPLDPGLPTRGGLLSERA